MTGAIVGGTNMVAIHLASAVGGNLFLGFISAVAFATILAVVAGLTLAGASAVSHDLYACVIKQGKAREEDEMRVTKLTTLTLGVVAILLGIIFEKQNIAFMVGLAFSIAASCNFPVLFLSMYWKGLSTRGALFGGSLGLFTALLLTIISPTVWVDVFGYAEAIFPYKYPALFSMVAAFVGIWFFSVTDKSKRAGRSVSASSPSSSARRPVWVQPAPSLTKANASRTRAALGLPFSFSVKTRGLQQPHPAPIVPSWNRAVSP